MKRRVAVRGIFINENKLLCVKLKPYNGAFAGNYWCVIGGGIDEGEALQPALAREIIEETAITPKIGSLLFIQQFAHNDTEHLEFFFNILNPKDYVHIDLSKTTHGQEEIELFEYINPENHDVRPKFLTEIDLSQLSENSPTIIYNYL